MELLHLVKQEDQVRKWERIGYLIELKHYIENV